MEIKSNLNTGSGRIDPSFSNIEPQTLNNAVKHTAPDFSGSEALKKTLLVSNDVRADMVAKAKLLVNDPTYPTIDVVKKIASLIARNLASQDL